MELQGMHLCFSDVIKVLPDNLLHSVRRPGAQSWGTHHLLQW